MDEDSNIVKRYRFDPFGNLEAQWGSFDSLIDIQYHHLILYAKGGLAQLGERGHRKPEVTGSIPVPSM